MTHTPGPWTPDFDVEPGKDIPIRVNLPCINGVNAWFEIAKVFAFDESETGYTDGVLNADATIANARLIAAAPKMLEALKQLVSAADNAAQDCNTGAMDLEIEAARDAIAKAEGKQ